MVAQIENYDIDVECVIDIYHIAIPLNENYKFRLYTIPNFSFDDIPKFNRMGGFESELLYNYELGTKVLLNVVGMSYLTYKIKESVKI